MNLSMMRMLAERLAEEQLYELLFVLLMVHRKERYMRHFFDYAWLDLTIARWGQRPNAVVRAV